MVVNSIIITPEKDKKLSSNEYPIENQDEIPFLMKEVINKTINDYGKLKDGISQVEKVLEVGDTIEEPQK